MPRSTDTGVCILCIDATATEDSSASRQGASTAQIERLHHRLADAGIALVWGVEASQSKLGRTLSQADKSTEVALVADGSWSSRDATRRQFGEGLAGGIDQFRSAGLTATTLVLPSVRSVEHDDLLVKHGVHVVRVDRRRASGRPSRGWWPRSGSSPTTGQMRTVRWGLWEADVSLNLEHGGIRAIVRTLDRLGREGGMAVIVADARHLAEDEHRVVKLLDHLRRKRSEGVVTFDTFHSLFTRLYGRRPAASARSILHSTAA
ncbi:MAG TPA: hypothetical protein VFI31_11415 [Pirellulales bacterium]|nr:hypothetical protein [Pirellulales bacterium]